MNRVLLAGLALAVYAAALHAEPAPGRGGSIPVPGRFKPRITVRVYDATRIEGRARREAMKRTRRLLAAAGLDAQFHDCSPGVTSSNTVCGTAPHSGELIVRMVQAPDAPADETRHVLGFATIDAGSRHGTLATVFTNRVAALSTLSRVPLETMLGRTIAHEIGHLLLGTNEHGSIGLMREVWTLDELINGRKEHWSFTAAEVVRLHGPA